jgi:hypothetical protein
LIIADSCNNYGKVTYRQDYSCKRRYSYRDSILLKEYAVCDIGEGGIAKYAKEYIYDSKNRLIQAIDYQETDSIKKGLKKIEGAYFSTKHFYKIKYSTDGFIISVKKFTVRNREIALESTHVFLYTKAKMLTKIKVKDPSTMENYNIDILYTTFTK